MKKLLTLFCLLFAAISCEASTIVAPTVNLVATTTESHNFHEAGFRITLRVTAPATNDVYVDKTATSLDITFYRNPGDGTRWQLVDAPGSPPKQAWLHAEAYEEVVASGGVEGDTAKLWRVEAGTSADFRLSMEISLNPFEVNMPTRLIALKLTHLNWGTSSSTEAGSFMSLGAEFQTQYVLLGPVPEPSSGILLATSGVIIGCMRQRRNANRT